MTDETKQPGQLLEVAPAIAATLEDEDVMTPEVVAELQSIQKALQVMQAGIDSEGNDSDLKMANAQKELDQAITDIDRLKLKIGSKEKKLREQTELLEKRGSGSKSVVKFGRSKPKKYEESFDKAQMEVAMLQSQLDQVAAKKLAKERMLKISELTRPEKQIESLEERRETLLLQLAPHNDNVLQLADTRESYNQAKAKVDDLEMAEKLLVRALTLSKRAGAYMEQHIRLSMTQGAANATHSISKKADVAFLAANTASISSLSGSIHDLRAARQEANQTDGQPKKTDSPGDRFTLESGASVPTLAADKAHDAAQHYRKAVQFNFDGGVRALHKVQTLYAEAEERLTRSGCMGEGVLHPGLVQNLLDTGLKSLDRSLAVREKREEEMLRKAAVMVPPVAYKGKAKESDNSTSNKVATGKGKRPSMQVAVAPEAAPGFDAERDLGHLFPSVVVDSPRNKLTTKFMKGHRRARSDIGEGVKDLVMPATPTLPLTSESNPDLTTSFGFVVLPETEAGPAAKDSGSKDRPKSDTASKKRASRSLTDASALPRTQAAVLMSSNMGDKERSSASHNTLSLPETATPPMVSVSGFNETHTHGVIPEVDEMGQSGGPVGAKMGAKARPSGSGGAGAQRMAATASLPAGSGKRRSSVLNPADAGQDQRQDAGQGHRRSTSASPQADTPSPRRSMGSVSGSVSNAVIGEGMAAVVAMQPALEKELERVRSALAIERAKLQELQPTYQRRRSTLMHAVAEEVIRKQSMTKQ
ncbi:hypothetical protein SARC_08068 [Sphaeroforma arctica JP610]|uniref:Uncharacterized protein n=1 Tax=Sphaeroforma arctica JP610 TaxID=667725 RepID=A0A0L0FSH3_9EUKA|nr:hypothetical protein SARC_08068 [Sphaeroforma arctica JP610]KNC79541.1 hypothetical protein SARC_08068 [Sphaeroforma arctica JP610]|eukprot:XP_014153443.1 hypothetical protein SARC_08068 [Sphaeroforma arctica JP610]